MKIKKITALFLALALSVGMSIPAFAVDLTAGENSSLTDGSSANIPVTLEAEAPVFSVTVPTALPIYLSQSGEVSVATDAKIVNNSGGSIVVSDVTVTPAENWTMVDYDAYATTKVGLKQFGLKINDSKSTAEGFDYADTILSVAADGNNELPLVYDVHIVAQLEAFNGSIASIVFTVGWYRDPVPGYEIQGDNTSASNVGTLYEDEDGSLVLAIGESYQLNAVAVYSLDTPTWESSNPEIATVSDDGLLTAVSYGETDITYTMGDDFGTMHLKVYEPFTVTSSNRATVGYTGSEGEDLVIPATFQDGDTWYKVTSIGDSVFRDCTSLTSVTIPESVTSIGNSAFYGCTSLTSINIPDSVTSIGSCAFMSCTSLTSINIPDSVTSIGIQDFYNCTSLTSVTIPSSVTSIGSDAFGNCSSLTSINIPDSVTSIGDQVFSDCTGLTSITIPSSVTSIGAYTFYGCTSLTSITIPDSVTSIGEMAFYNCTGLTSITIPDGVTSIGAYTFYNCTSLTDVYYTGTEEQWSAIGISSGNTYLTSATIHYNS